MTDTYPSAQTLNAPSRFNKVVRPVAAAASIPLAAIGIASCSAESSRPFPPRDSFVEVHPNHDRLINKSDPTDGMNPFPEPKKEWSPQKRAEEYHLQELVDGNPCKPEKGSTPIIEKYVEVADFRGKIQLKATNPACENSFYARAETVTNRGTNTAPFTVETRVLPSNPAENPYRVRQDSLQDDPAAQAWTVQVAAANSLIQACILSGQQEVCLDPHPVGQAPQ